MNIWIIRFLGDVAEATSAEGAALAAKTLREDREPFGIPQGAWPTIIGPIRRDER